MKILLVDDEPDLLRMTARCLKRKKVDCVIAAGMDEARQAVLDSGNEFDAIVCDLFLGVHENGIDFYEILRSQNWLKPFVVVTGDDAGDRRIAQYIGVDDRFACLQKPFDFECLIALLGKESKA